MRKVIKKIPFKQIHIQLLTEVRKRQENEINEALQLIYQDLGIDVAMKRNLGSYELKGDLSGIEKVIYQDERDNRKA